MLTPAGLFPLFYLAAIGRDFTLVPSTQLALLAPQGCR